MISSKTFIVSDGYDLLKASTNNEGKWIVETLLAGKGVTCLTANPENPQILFAGTQQQGIWRSGDGGLSWKNSGLNEHCVKSLAINRHNSDIIYAGTKAARMFISKDGAETWKELDAFRRISNRWWWFSPAEPPDFRPYVIAIAPSVSDPNVILAGVEFGGVMRSVDNGQSWSRHIKGALRDCHSLKFHAADGQRVYQAGGTGGGAAFSNDGGKTFRRKKRGLAKNYGIVCAADPADPDIWYVCVASSPFKAFGKQPESYLYRTNSASDWQPIGWERHPLPATATVLATLKDAPGHLYAGLTNGDIWHSADYGDNWDKLPFNLKGIWFSMLVL